MGVRNFQSFQNALDTAILAPLAMKRIEADVGLQSGKGVGNVSIHIDPRDAIANRFKRVRAGRTGIKRHLALSGPASHQDSYMVKSPVHKAAASSAPEALAAIPMRLISHSSWMPL